MWVTPKFVQEENSIANLCSSLFERYSAGPHESFFDSSKPLTVVSDYAGQDRKATVDVYAFTFFQPHQNLKQLTQLREIINRADSKSKGAGRRLRYNRLRGDGVAQTTLLNLLPVWRDMKALVIEVALDKAMSKQAWEKEVQRELWHPEFVGRFQKFDPSVRRHVSQLAIFTALLFYGLTECKHFEWITDNDDAVANERLASSFVEIVQALVWNMDESRTLTLHVSKNRPESEALLSLVDVVAGSGVAWVSEFVQSGQSWKDDVPMAVGGEIRAALPHVFLRRPGGRLRWWNVWVRPAEVGLIASRFYDTPIAQGCPTLELVKHLDRWYEGQR